MQISYSDTNQSSQSKSANPAAECSKPDNEKGGCQKTCISTAETSGNSTGNHGLESWIASQRDSLARIFRVQAKASELPENEADLSGKCFGEVFRAIDAVRPSLIFLENSPCIRTRGRKEITAALVERGYCWRDGVLAASDVGAPHKRNRWWLLAANPDGLRQLEQERGQQDKWRRSGDSDEVSADALRIGLQRAVRCGVLSNIDAGAIEAAARYTAAYSWSPPDTGICRMVDGVANQLDFVFRGSKRNRIAAAGNGQVPLQAAVAWLILAHTI